MTQGSPNGADSSPPSPTTETGETGSAGSPAAPLQVTLTPRPGRAEGSFRLVFQADRPATLRADWAWGSVRRDEPDTRHTLLLAGFAPDLPTAVELEWTEADGRVGRRVLTLRAPPLPPSFPEFRLLAHDPARAAPGLTLAPMRPAAGSAYDDEDWLVALAPDGQVLWRLRLEGVLYDARLTAQGTLLGALAGRLFEWDLTGEVLASWEPEGWGTDALDLVGVPFALHHEVAEAPDGGLVALAMRELAHPAWPTSYRDPSALAPAQLAEDLVVHFQRDGTVDWILPLGEVLDPARIGYDSLRPSVQPEWRDWAHANAVVPLEDGRVLVSLRHQDAMVLLDPARRAVDWILGNPDNWREPWSRHRLAPVGEVSWSYHQHGPSLSPDGEWLVFDNGNERASPYTDQPRQGAGQTWSRLVAYRVDEVAGTVESTWIFDGPPGEHLFSQALGDADALPGGTVLATYGWVTHRNFRPVADSGRGAHLVRFLEVDRATRDVVWMLEASTDGEVQPEGWHANRAQRILQLGPG